MFVLGVIGEMRFFGVEGLKVSGWFCGVGFFRFGGVGLFRFFVFDF